MKCKMNLRASCLVSASMEESCNIAVCHMCQRQASLRILHLGTYLVGDSTDDASFVGLAVPVEFDATAGRRIILGV